jgi:hypothetical protein
MIDHECCRLDYITEFKEENLCILNEMIDGSLDEKDGQDMNMNKNKIGENLEEVDSEDVKMDMNEW